jgi:DNA-binding beta-propeller fold protein YncE
MPTVLAPAVKDQNVFAGIAVDTMNIYFTDSKAGTVMSLPIAGGNAMALASSQASPGAIVSDAQNVYWINDGDKSLNQVPIAGGMSIVLASGNRLGGLVVDGASVYFTDRGAGLVQQVPVGGGVVKPLAMSQAEPLAVTVAAGNLYWTNYNGGKVGTISKLPMGTANASVIPGSNESGPVALTHDDACLYWINFDSKEVRKAGQ